MLFSVQFDIKGPVAIRYPRGRGRHLDWRKSFQRIETGKGRLIKKGKDLAILSVGPLGEVVQLICKKKAYNNLAHYDMRFVKPLDEDLLDEIFETYKMIITIEEGALKGGFGDAVLAYKNRKKAGQVLIECLGLPDKFIEHGSMQQLYELVGLDQRSIENRIDRIRNNKNC